MTTLRLVHDSARSETASTGSPGSFRDLRREDLSLHKLMVAAREAAAELPEASPWASASGTIADEVEKTLRRHGTLVGGV